MLPLIPLEQARQIVLSAVSPGPVVRVPLRAAVGRTLAEAVVCDVDYPPFDRAMMDGFAVRSADVAAAPVELTVVGRIAAGSQPDRPLAGGQAMQINTGAPIPDGCDAVVPVEDSDEHGRKVAIRVSAWPGQHISGRGTCVRAGQTVLEAGTRLLAGQIAIAAAAGVTTVAVYQQPSVGILVTGDELVEPACTPVGGQLRASNSYLLDALVRQAQCRPVDLGRARDDPKLLTERIREGLKAGFLCSTGGVSMGELDCVPACLEACGASIRFHRVAVKPGRPTLFATADNGACVFGLPGNPVSAFVAFWLFVAPALARRQGRPGAAPGTVSATLAGAIGATGDRRPFLPARVWVADGGGLTVEPLPGQGSGDPFALAQANALLDAAPNAPPRRAGDSVRVLLLELP